MKITINIKNCGEGTGTVGDLVRGLQSGKYRFEEKRYKDGTIGLWLLSKDNKLRQNVAGYNVYGMTHSQAGWNPFRFELGEIFALDQRDIWTDSAWDTIQRVANQWVRDKNDEISSENPANIHLVKVREEGSV